MTKKGKTGADFTIMIQKLGFAAYIFWQTFKINKF